MNITYAITLHDEWKEYQLLYKKLCYDIRGVDRILVLLDRTGLNLEGEHYRKLRAQTLAGDIQLLEGNFEGDFAVWKNKIFQYADGDWIFQIDADEYPSTELLRALPEMLPDVDVDLIYVPRINTVEGITEQHRKKWGWIITQHFGTQCINFPDYQGRIYRNDGKLKWEGKVHEQIVGYDKRATLPAELEWCLHHPKTIERQERQNNFYETLA